MNNKFHLFLCIYATHFNSKILQNHSTSILHSCRHLKVQPTKFMGNPAFWLAWGLLKVKLFQTLPPTGSICIFLMYLVLATCQWLSDVAWQIHMLVTADMFKEICLQRYVGAKDNLFVKNRNSIPLEFKQTLPITFYHTRFTFFLFWISVGFSFNPFLTTLPITPQFRATGQNSISVWNVAALHQASTCQWYLDCCS